MQSLDDFAARKLGELDRASLHRTLAETDRLDGIWVERNGRRLLSFSCNDYLNLTHHPAVKAAAIAAIERYGVGGGASRLVTGNHPLFARAGSAASPGSRAPRPPACSARAISPIPASFRR